MLVPLLPTCQSLEKGRTLLVGARTVDTTALPVSPASHILEALVEGTVLHVLGTENALSATGIDKVLEGDFPGGTILLGPLCGNRAPKTRLIELRCFAGGRSSDRSKLNAIDLRSIEDLGTAATSMLEQQLIGLGANDIPSVAISSARSEEVGVLRTLSINNAD